MVARRRCHCDTEVAGIVVKLNQFGTVTETLATIRMAREAGYRAVVSDHSGETEALFIADFVVATGVGEIKAGPPARSERVAKYSQLLRIRRAAGRSRRVRRPSGRRDALSR